MATAPVASKVPETWQIHELSTFLFNCVCFLELQCSAILFENQQEKLEQFLERLYYKEKKPLKLRVPSTFSLIAAHLPQLWPQQCHYQSAAGANKNLLSPFSLHLAPTRCVQSRALQAQSRFTSLFHVLCSSSCLLPLLQLNHFYVLLRQRKKLIKLNDNLDTYLKLH